MKKVTVIQEDIQTYKKLRVAAYCRVSTNSEDQANSFNAQVEYFQRYISYNPDMILVEVYADEGISGTSTKKREDFMRMLYDARQHKFERLLVKSVARFGRNTADTLTAIRELNKYGISVFFEGERLDTNVIKGELLETILFSCAQDSSQKKSYDIKRANQMRAKLGVYHPGSEALGLSIDKDKKCYVIDKESAKAKEVMKEMYLNGAGSEKIAKKLNELGYKTFDGKQWTNNRVIQYLINEKNYGDVCLNKYVNEGFPGKRIKNPNEDAKTLLKDQHEALFNREEEAMISKILQYRYKKLNTYFGPKDTYLYSSKLKCAYCGSNLVRKIAHKGKPYEVIRWQCSKHAKDSKACPLKAVNEQKIDKAFVKMFNKLKTHYNIILLPYLNDLNRLQLTIPDQKRVSEINIEILEIKKQSQALTRCRVSKQIDSAFYYSRLAELEKERLKLNEERGKIYEQFENSLDTHKTRLLLEVIENYQGVMDEFESSMFMAIVKSVVISEDSITFELINKFSFTERRKDDD